MKTHAELDVWKLSMELVTDIYKVTRTYPASERYGLVSQMRKSAVSVPSNIAEGAARFSDKEFLRFLGISRGSLLELETQLIICQRIGIHNFNQEFFNRIQSIMRLINILIRHLKNKKRESN